MRNRSLLTGLTLCTAALTLAFGISLLFGEDSAADELPATTNPNGPTDSPPNPEPSVALASKSFADDQTTEQDDEASLSLGQAAESPDPVRAERDRIIAGLRSGRLSASEQSHSWRRLAELGIADEVIALLEKELEADPFNDALYTMIGNAYVTKIRSGDLNPIERRAASRAAMSSFNKALEIQPRNWTARFSRAMSNSSAPAFLGLQKRAIDDFELLIEQQKTSPSSDDHAHTYMFLANLHEGSGNQERATALRREARHLFPQDPRFQPSAPSRKR